MRASLLPCVNLLHSSSLPLTTSLTSRPVCAWMLIALIRPCFLETGHFCLIHCSAQCRIHVTFASYATPLSINGCYVMTHFPFAHQAHRQPCTEGDLVLSGDMSYRGFTANNTRKVQKNYFDHCLQSSVWALMTTSCYALRMHWYCFCFCALHNTGFSFDPCPDLQLLHL